MGLLKRRKIGTYAERFARSYDLVVADTAGMTWDEFDDWVGRTGIQDLDIGDEETPERDASIWRGAELADSEGPGGEGLRTITFWHWVHDTKRRSEMVPVVMNLGETLFDEGEFGPPYDNAGTFDPIGIFSPGPNRLSGLIALAFLATRTRHPRASRWSSDALGSLAQSTEAASVLAPGVVEMIDELRQAAPRPVASGIDPMDQLRKLAELRDAGVISEDEFTAKREKLLDQV